jgi:cell wall-associated NlpC family hydrolase
VSVSESAERAAALLERLLSDPAYRSEFRADPARACAEEGLPEVAEQLGRGRAMQTLEIRESRSSLAGVLMAAALEGASLAVLVDHAEAASSVDPTAASALAQLTQSHQAVAAPPAAVDPPAPVDPAAPAVVDPNAVATAAPVDPAAAAPPADPAAVTPPPVAEPPPPADPPAPAVDVIGASPAAAASDPSVQFMPAVTQTDPSTLPPSTPAEPLTGSPAEAPSVPPAPVQPVTGVLQQVADQQSAAVQAPATVGAMPAVAAQVDALAVASGGPNPYPGNEAGQEAIAAWMARDAQAAGLPPELPVMASLVESGLTNMSGGDRDSMGFFQMRAGIWDRGEYAGYSQNPELQMKWFIDHALAIKAKRIADGDATFGQDPSTYGNWIADVEIPYEPYRGRYQLRLEDAQALLANVSSGAPAAAAAPAADAAVAAATPIPAADISGPVVELAPGVPVMDAEAASPTALNAIKVAGQYLGTSYHFGGASPETGFDCSGLMQWAYSHSGVTIPRVTYDQIDVGVHIDRSHLVPGDLVFFENNGDVHHVGMYLGGGRFLHAPHTGDVVKVSSLDDAYYAAQFAGGRRMA